MKAFVASVVAAVVISVIAAVVLGNLGFSSANVYQAPQSVRL